MLFSCPAVVKSSSKLALKDKMNKLSMNELSNLPINELSNLPMNELSNSEWTVKLINK